MTKFSTSYRRYGAFSLFLIGILLFVGFSQAAPKYNEAPDWSILVKQGKLPAVDKRLPSDPMVVKPLERVGKYGGEWKMGTKGAGDEMLWSRMVGYEPLVRSNKQLNGVIPNVAKSWTVSPDASTFTFQLRSGMKWSDGQPFTSADILFWFNDVLGNEQIYPNIPTWLITDKQPVKLTAKSDYEVEFKFSKPNSIFLIALTTSFSEGMLIPKHYLKKYLPKYSTPGELEALVEEGKAKNWAQLFLKKMDPYRNTELPTLNAWIIDTPIGAGSKVIFKRNPYYWKIDTKGNQLPYIDRLVGIVVERTEVLNMMAVAGEFDFQYRNLLSTNRPLFEQNKDKSGYKVLEWYSTSTNMLNISFNINHKDPGMRKIFEDKRFRYAMSYAIDRKAIIDTVWDGQAEPRQPAAFKGTAYYDPSYEKNAIQFDVKKANKLLDQMGLTKKDGQGYRLRPDGKPLFITMEVQVSRPDRVDAAEMIKKYWQTVGVNCAVKPLESNLFYLRAGQSQHDVALDTGMAGGIDLVIQAATHVANANARCYHAPLNALYYESGGERGEAPQGDLKKVQDLYSQFIITPSPEAQKKIMMQIMKINSDNLWILGICTAPPAPAVAKKNFHNVESWLHGLTIPSPGQLASEQFFIQ
jgi:peptide/nickel transport system substrate-binding protein